MNKKPLVPILAVHIKKRNFTGMGFYRKIKYFLVHDLKFSNKQAQALIDAGVVELDGRIIRENAVLQEHSEIKVQSQVKRAKKEFVYLKFHKPAGFESTLHTEIENNISAFFTAYTGLAIAGRLDKQSQGLMLLSNDGKWVEQMCNPKFEKEKEYRVTLNRMPDAQFFSCFESGVNISDYVTAPCICRPVENRMVKIILKEGKNRQIRRMCKALGYKVEKLERIRIDQLLLDDLKPGEKAEFQINLLNINNLTISVSKFNKIDV